MTNEKLKMIDLKLKDADVIYYPNVFRHEQCDYYFNHLLDRITWQQDDISLFGKTYKQPRLTALYANNAKPYSYSNITMYPLEFDALLTEIKSKIEASTKEIFTSCLLNLYRDGSDSNGWHADDEKELGVNPIIASVSFGFERVFHLKHKTKTELRHKIILQNGSLLVMKGETQHHWLHQLPKTKKQVGTRINLTFRNIK